MCSSCSSRTWAGQDVLYSSTWSFTASLTWLKHHSVFTTSQYSVVKVKCDAYDMTGYVEGWAKISTKHNLNNYILPLNKLYKYFSHRKWNLRFLSHQDQICKRKVSAWTVHLPERGKQNNDLLFVDKVVNLLKDFHGWEKAISLWNCSFSFDFICINWIRM